MKTCSTCKATKPLDEFHLDRSRPDGHQRVCRSCSTARERARSQSIRPIFTLTARQRRVMAGLTLPSLRPGHELHPAEISLEREDAFFRAAHFGPARQVAFTQEAVD